MNPRTLIRTIRHAGHVIERQSAEIDELHEILQKLAGGINYEMYKQELESLRSKQHLLLAWLISLEHPEEDVREHLAAAEQELAAGIARLEEHIL